MRSWPATCRSQGGAKPTPISLSRYTLLLPTRRATRALQEAFLAASGGAALLLPKIRPIGDGIEDLSLLAGAAGLVEPAGDPDIPPAISELQRRLVLTELVMQWSRAAAGAARRACRTIRRRGRGRRRHAGAGGTRSRPNSRG